MTRYLVAAFLAATSLPVLGHGDEDRIIGQASELVSWCRAEAEAHYVAKGITPYQWTSSYHDKGNVLHVDGRLRVHGNDVEVHCRIARGAREKYAVIEIDDPEL